MSTPNAIIQTREAWLVSAVDTLRPAFNWVGLFIPEKLGVSCGWPVRGAGSLARPALAECWSKQLSADQTFEIFISPAIDEPERVLVVLAHELIHASVGLDCEHRGMFRDAATALGFVTPMSRAVPGPELKERLHALSSEIGPYPHQRILTRLHDQLVEKDIDGDSDDGAGRLHLTTSGRTRQNTRMVKIVCPCCGYLARTTRRWISVGLPTCPCGAMLMSTEPLR
ncbi:MAG: hypothetical protein ACT4PL_08555 [Phycisphaerales bacterium]